MERDCTDCRGEDQSNKERARAECAACKRHGERNVGQQERAQAKLKVYAASAKQECIAYPAEYQGKENELAVA